MSLQNLRRSGHESRNRSIHGRQTMNAVRYGDWSIEIDQRILGSTVHRIQYSAVIHRAKPYHHEFLSGFKNKQAAKKAAEDRIDEIGRVERPVWRPAGWRLRQRK